MNASKWEAAWKLYRTATVVPSAEAETFAAAASDDPEVQKILLSLLQGGGGAVTPLEEGRSGEQLGRYVLTELLGAGGMGEVYAARDSELGRAVAIKLILASAAGGGLPADERIMREAKAASALNHPNIVAVHEVVKAPNRFGIVMERVEGIALRSLIGAPLPVDQVLHLGRQIAGALAAAHAHGIIHGDLKPENVMVRGDGIVKVLDFGLARDIGSAQASSSGPKLWGGTFRYLSPEQSQGEPASAASDVFAFGLLLYELTTARHPFESDSLFAAIRALNERTPAPASSLNPHVPARLDALMARMLAKDPPQRPKAAEVERTLAAIFRDASRNGAEPAGLPGGVAAPVTPRPLANRTPVMAWALAAFGVLALAGTGIYHFSRGPASAAEPLLLDIVTPSTDDRSGFALSPDGRRIAYTGSEGAGPRRLWIRALNSAEAQPVAGTEGASSPFWSPDSKSVGFFADFKLKRVDLDGGQPQVLAPATSIYAQGAWGAHGDILMAWGLGPVLRVPAAGGTPTIAGKPPNPQQSQLSPRFLPDGRRYLYVVNGAQPGIYLSSLDGSAAPVRVANLGANADSQAEYLAAGWLVRVRRGALEAQRYDLDRHAFAGEAVTLARSVGVDSSNLTGTFSVASAGGGIAWRQQGEPRRQLRWFDRSGKELGPFGEVGDANWFAPALSPDGTKAATMRGVAGSSDIWIQDGARSRRLTVDRGARYPIWSPDGRQVAYTSTRNGKMGIYARNADGSGGERLLFESEDFKRLNAWSPDGKFILYASGQNTGDLMMVSVGRAAAAPFVVSRFNECEGAFSPDGRWVAYQSDETGVNQVYVRPFPEKDGATTQVSTTNGRSPRWTADGRAITFVSSEDTIMSAPVVVREGKMLPGEPAPVFRARINPAANRPQYDVARDGRFLILTDLPDQTAAPIRLLLHWSGR